MDLAKTKSLGLGKASARRPLAILRNAAAISCLAALSACSAKKPTLERSAGCFAIIAFSSEPLYFPLDKLRWERALEKNFERPALFEQIDKIVAKIDELEDSTDYLNSLNNSCAEVLEYLETSES